VDYEDRRSVAGESGPVVLRVRMVADRSTRLTRSADDTQVAVRRQNIDRTWCQCDAPGQFGRIAPAALLHDALGQDSRAARQIADATRNESSNLARGETLLRQAGLQYRLFTGRDAPMDLMRDMLKRATNPAKR